MSGRKEQFFTRVENEIDPNYQRTLGRVVWVSILLSFLYFAFCQTSKLEWVKRFDSRFLKASSTNSPYRLFGDLEFDPLDRFDLGNMKFTWFFTLITILVFAGIFS